MIAETCANATPPLRAPHSFWHRAAILQLACLSLIPAGCTVAQNPGMSGGTGGPSTLPETRWAASSTVPDGSDARPGEVGFPEFPSLSPDGRWVVFSWAGDLWVAPTEATSADAPRTATRLTSHPAEERRSAFSPDGSMLAFESDRDGARNLYVMPLTQAGGTLVGGPVSRVTVSDRAEWLGSFSADGKALYFSSDRTPAIYSAPHMYRVELLAENRGFTGVGGPVTELTPAFGWMPRASADGASIVFGRNRPVLERPKYRGSGNQELYRFNLRDGSFDRLTTSPANDAEGVQLPDGSLVFISSRDGQNNLWRLGKGQPDEQAKQLTRFAPTREQYTLAHGVRDLNVSADGRTAVFCVWDRLYTLDLAADASPRAMTLNAGADALSLDFDRKSLDKEVSEAALSPDGKTIAVIARGEVFVRSTQEGYPTRRVTATAGRERDLAWSPDGQWLYFSSDEPVGRWNDQADPRPLGAYGLFRAGVELAREDIAPKAEEESKKEGAGKDEPKNGEGKKEDDRSDDKKADNTPKKGEKDKKKEDDGPDVGKRWADSLRFKVEPLVLINNDARSPAPSPDGERLMYTRGRGDIIVRDLASGNERTLIESVLSPEVSWTDDARHVLATITDLDYNSDVWIVDAGDPEPKAAEPAQTEAGKTDGGQADQSQPATEEPSRTGWTKLSTGFWGVNITRHPDIDASPRLSADGKVLVFLSERGSQDDEVDVWMVLLDKELESKTPYEFDEYIKKAAEAAGKRKPLALKKPKTDKAEEAKPEEPKPETPKAEEAKADEKSDGKTDDKKDPQKDEEKGKDEGKAKSPARPKPFKFDAGDAYMRVRRLTTIAGSEADLALTPGADRVVFSATIDGDRQLVSIDHKGKDRKQIVAGDVGDVRMSLTGDKVSFVKGGVAQLAPKAGGKVEPMGIDAPVVIDVAAQQRQKFLEAARILGERFYHPTLKGLDWNTLTKRYADLISRTRTSATFNRVTQLLFGELEGSHTGIWGGDKFTAPPVNTGYLGVRVKPVTGGYEVVRVTADTPADEPGTKLSPGDVIVSIDGQRLAKDDASMPTIDFDAAMAGKADKETLVELRASKPAEGEAAGKTGAPSRYVLIVPQKFGAWDQADYDDEVMHRREQVEKLSAGRLGYLHIQAMGEESVRSYERDLYAAASGKQGLIIDVRDNGGGYTADILLASLTAPRHAYTIPRGLDPADVPRDVYPRDRRLIYAWTRPINVLINQNSFSNAEIFAHAIQTIGRGKLIGTATFGGVISTGAERLIDGTTVRTPGRGWYLPDGSDQENNGARPDVPVEQTPQDEAAGKDPQLEAAVKELLSRIDRK